VGGKGVQELFYLLECEMMNCSVEIRSHEWKSMKGARNDREIGVSVVVRSSA
jgi:hypothetical protein